MIMKVELWKWKISSHPNMQIYRINKWWTIYNSKIQTNSSNINSLNNNKRRKKVSFYIKRGTLIFICKNKLLMLNFYSNSWKTMALGLPTDWRCATITKRWSFSHFNRCFISYLWCKLIKINAILLNCYCYIIGSFLWRTAKWIQVP